MIVISNGAELNLELGGSGIGHRKTRNGPTFVVVAIAVAVVFIVVLIPVNWVCTNRNEMDNGSICFDHTTRISFVNSYIITFSIILPQ